MAQISHYRHMGVSRILIPMGSALHSWGSSVRCSNLQMKSSIFPDYRKSHILEAAWLAIQVSWIQHRGHLDLVHEHSPLVQHARVREG